MKTVGITIKKSINAKNALIYLFEYLKQRNVSYYLDKDSAKFVGEDPAPTMDFIEMGKSCDFIIALGGDGTLLNLARKIGTNIPIIAVNLGRLGFITEINLEELPAMIECFLDYDYKTQSRGMLSGTVIRNKIKTRSTRFKFLALNEILISSSAERILKLDLEINDELVTTYSADGLIVATPTGSTGHSLSAGGPIVHPSCNVFSLVPVCPHTLSNRPLLISNDDIITITHCTDHAARLVVDGQESFELEKGDMIVIGKAHDIFTLVLSPNRSYYEVLRTKLGWGG